MTNKEMNDKIRVFMSEPESSSKFGQIPYHLKWDCLMPVVERINKRDWVTIYNDECKIHALIVDEFETIDTVKEGEPLILAVYEAVYKYVEWYLANVA